MRTAAPDREVAARPSAPAGSQRLLAAGAANLAEHRRRNGVLPHFRDRDRLVSTVEDAGLAGRGGAGFPTWRKLAAVAAGDRPVVVANGAETEPASTKDQTLLSRAPHLVLDGLRLAAQAVGARHTYLYLGAGPAADSVRKAIAERRTAGWDRERVDVVEAPDWFVAGEQSALISAIEGRPALPRDKPRRVVEAGVHGRPTLVQNVETLAHLALLARYGPAWFRSQGTPTEPGTFLATVSGAVATAGVYEAPYGIPLRDLLALAGAPFGELQAVLVGGYHGAWIPASEAGVAVSRASLAPLGASPGAGVVVALPMTRCGLADSARIAVYLARQSAGQCGPCVNGLPRLADTLARLANRQAHPGLANEVRRLAGLVTGRGACQHPDGTARFALSTLRAFDDEVRLHLAGRCIEDAERTLR
jgi:NADH:ubiquinone oxidoreductase subunit F (NADH-binding)